jgi:hypothetical protein
MTNLSADTAVASKLSRNSRIGTVVLDMTFLATVEARARFSRLGAIILGVTMNSSGLS